MIIQGHDIEQAYGDKYNKNFATNLEYLTNYIKSFDSTVEIGWYMTWRRNGGEGFARLQAYWETMQQTVATNENVSFIVPIGTAVENARGTYINQFNYRPESQSNIAKVNLLTGQSIGSTMTPDNNNGIQRDETHMSAVVGRFLAGYIMGEMLVNHINELGGAQFTKKTAIEKIYSYDPNIGLLPAEYVQTIKACAEAAMAYPYAVTPLTDHAIDPVQTVKTLVESADFTNTEWNGTAIQDKVAGELLAQKPGAKVTGVNISGNTATVTLRYGYSEATATIYTPSDAAAQWTSYIESTKLGSTTVPGSDMKYSEAPDIQKAMADGYSAIWAAKTETEAQAALAAAKANLLATVKAYVKFLLDTVYNNGSSTVLGDVAYTLSEEAYTKASGDIDAATTEAGVLTAYNTALSEQTSKEHPRMTKTDAVAATCAATGNSAYWTCDVCGKFFSDENGKTEITEKSWVIPATGKHDWSNRDGICTVCKTPCSEVHIAGRICPVCGKYTPAPTPVIPVTPSKPAKPSFNPDAGKTKFVDVSDNAWYASAVDYVVDKGLMNGTGEDKFSPNADTTRGMIVTVLARLDGKSTAGTPWFAAGQRWAMEYEISDGTNMTGAITREQLVAMLFRYAVKNGLEAVTLSENLTQFTDASDISAWAVSAMQWAVGQGLIQGSNGQLHPQANASRAEVATILMRFCELMKK